MPPRDLPKESPKELVIGIDFGTTYSKVSYAMNDDPKIHVVRNWPDPKAPDRTSNKVPSALTYHIEKPHKVLDWGFGAVRRRDRQESDLFEWFKLLLPRTFNKDTATNADIFELMTLQNLLIKYNKTAEEVTVDYLGCIWRHTEKHLRRQLGYRFMDPENYTVIVVFTIPTIWEPDSRSMIRALARKAGLPTNILFVQEPEAAAMELLKSPGQVNVGDIITVCDAGGGTCDLTTYEVLRLPPNMKVKEFEVGEGGFCGSIFIDKAFEVYIERLIGPLTYSKIAERHKKKMMHDFDYGIKPTFQYGLNQNQNLSVDLRGVIDNIPLGIEDETILLNLEELDKVFHQTCLKVHELVERQVRRAIEQEKSTVVLLVGGFGECSYLFDLLYSKLCTTNVVLLQGKKPWTAVCRGATLWGLERCTSPNDTIKEMTIESRKSQYNYGIIDTALDDPTKNGIGEVVLDRFWDPVDAIYRTRQIKWIVTKGTEIKDGDKYTIELQRVVRIQFFDFGLRRFHDELLYSGSDSPSLRRENASVKSLGFLPWKVNCKKIRWHERRTASPSTGRAYFKFKFTLELILGSSSMEVYAIYRGKKVGMVEVVLNTEDTEASGLGGVSLHPEEEHVLEDKPEASIGQYNSLPSSTTTAACNGPHDLSFMTGGLSG